MGKVKTILITGATGYLGSKLAVHFQDKYKIKILKRSFDDISRIRSFINKIQFYNIDKTPIANAFNDKVDIIIHTATLYGRNDEQLFEIVECNLKYPLTLLNVAVKRQVEYFINTDTVLPRMTNEYSLTKKQFLEWLIYYKKRIKTINVKLEHFYGPEDNDSKFITYLVKNMLQHTESIKLTKGTQKRDFIYIDDLINFYSVLLKNIDSIKSGYTEFHVGSGVNYTIKEVVEKVKELTNSITKPDFGALPFREHELIESKVDIEPLKEFGWVPKIRLEEGLKKLIYSEKQKNV